MGIFLSAIIIGLRLTFYSPFFVEGESMAPTLKSGEFFVLDKWEYRNEVPRRGEIVIFTLAEEPNYFYVKRIVGIPGDKIKLTQQGVFVQSKGERAYTKLAENYLPVQPIYYGFDRHFDVPEGKYFVLGDNRQHSKDSRYYVDPYVPQNRILGRFFFGF